MKRLIFFAHSMQIGGLERALLRATYCLEHRQEILALYEQWRLSNAALSRNTVDAFLRIKS